MGIHEFSVIRCCELKNDCPRLRDRIVRSVSETPRLTDWSHLHTQKSSLYKAAFTNSWAELDLIVDGRNNAARSRNQNFWNRTTTVRERKAW